MAQAEGKTFEYFGEEVIKPEYLEVFDFDSKNQYIKTETHEFSAVCPFSGLPDYAHLIIEYYPDGNKCVELKSLKYYITSYRNAGIYQEKATRKLYDDLKAVLNTQRIKITTVYNIRGGFLTTCVEGSL
jgi:7-cyano-7-deazaguanine reductase